VWFGDHSNISLAWNALTGDSTLYGYEVLRGARLRPYKHRGTVTGNSYEDKTVVGGATYTTWCVRLTPRTTALASRMKSARCQAAQVAVTFNVTVPRPPTEPVSPCTLPARLPPRWRFAEWNRELRS